MNIRGAGMDDLKYIVEMLADDKLGSQRENIERPPHTRYINAFGNILLDPNQELMVVENEHKKIIGTFQLSFIQYLTYQGGVRAQIEAVRIRKDQRGVGLGKKMFDWAIERAKERGAHLIQLTTDKKRPEAIKFYNSIGFVATHEGMKLHLNQQSCS